MAKNARRRKRKEEEDIDDEEGEGGLRLHPDTKKSVAALILFGLAVIFTLSSIHRAGPAGDALYRGFDTLVGIGYYLIPATLVLAAIVFVTTGRKKIYGVTAIGSVLLLGAGLGFIDIVSPDNGGWIGTFIGLIQVPFGSPASLVIVITALLAGILLIVNAPIRVRLPQWGAQTAVSDDADLSEKEVRAVEEAATEAEDERMEEEEEAPEPEKKKKEPEEEDIIGDEEPAAGSLVPHFRSGSYVPPSLDLLRTSAEKATAGDLRINANMIKRTLESFGVPVEMEEITVGPKITRYALKPAEGIRLSKITALNQDLALALAAHPIRIEAPIPGKSLVGIEVPNKTAATVRLGTIMKTNEFAQTGPLGFVIGRDVTGEPLFGDIAGMPHLLVAGATGSGKSVMIHSLILSLIYKNSPETLRMIMIDPKRVELSVYDGIPHLISSVVTENKKAVGVFRWALNEMDRRYDLLMNAQARDIAGYNASHKKDVLPYILIVVDELADLMSTFGREVEGSVVRLAQMARAVGIHLILSTQRPSVEVITGLIKANITSRIALQVASQIDSRTILDAGGAEKLLGGGDLLFISPKFSKPKRLQGAFVTEAEVRAVADFIRENNTDAGERVEFAPAPAAEDGKEIFDEFANGDADDEMYHEAVTLVTETKKASASFLQRRLKVGYARAARLLDMMEERNIIGPSNGAKPRDVY
ncbi:MAG: DNA translocase FtsK [Candidatus Liptonbacteria bacterium]|nr:DNA translocase FtsK [Candidatus Liptonbacteria bacterium]